MNMATVGDMQEYFRKLVQQETGMDASEVDPDRTFHELGLDSISAVYLLEQIEQRYNITFTPLYFWDYPTIRKLAVQLHRENFL